MGWVCVGGVTFRLLFDKEHDRCSAYGILGKGNDDVLLTFCAGCPGPVKAMRLIVECLDPMSDEELVDRTLAMPLRRMADVPLSELPDKSPLRAVAV